MRETQKQAAAFKQVIKETKQFLLLTHLDPDGDALGSACGLAYILKKMKKQVVIGLSEALPTRYEFLNHDESLRFLQPERINPSKYGAIIVLDSSTLDRLDKFKNQLQELDPAISLVNIDRHADNSRFGTLNIIDSDSASVSQMIVELLGSRALDINSAWCLYAGMVHNTGSFRHGVNIKRTHEAAIHCLSFPIDSKQVYNQLFSLETATTLQLFARALSRLKLSERGRIVSMYLVEDDYREIKAEPEMANGFVNKLVTVEGAELVVFFNEIERNTIKVSFSSNIDFSVADIASSFGGGGHTRAAGCLIEGIMEQVVERVLKRLEITLKNYDKAGKGQG